MERFLSTPHLRNIVCAFVVLTIPATAYSVKPVPEPPPGEIRDCGAISEPGFYSVTQDLPGTGGLLLSGDCISVEVSGVTIDLNSHSITGIGSGSAVTDGGNALENVTVRNGAVTGFENGVSLTASSDSVVENIRASSNSQDGISLGVRGVARLNIASQNLRGLVVTCPANIIGNSAWDNASDDLFQNDSELCLTQESLNSFGSSGSGGEDCPTYLADCSGVCRDLNIDEYNCGSCGAICAPGELCVDGSCTLECPSGQIAISGICVNPQNDNEFCGASENDPGEHCPGGEICIAGVCTLTCQASLLACSGTCVDPSTDEANCGGCGNTCTLGDSCIDGICVAVVDVDGDGYTSPLDCDDGDPGINPGIEETPYNSLCGDGVDQNCDGIDPPCFNP